MAARHRVCNFFVLTLAPRLRILRSHLSKMRCT